MAERKNDSTWFNNPECEYYPCHKYNGAFNCKFCFCPLYPYPDCDGDFIMLEKNIKDCSKCLTPHLSEGYDYILWKLKEKWNASK